MPCIPAPTACPGATVAILVLRAPWPALRALWRVAGGAIAFCIELSDMRQRAWNRGQKA